MTSQMNATYINALLADASYVELTNPDGSIASANTIKANLKDRLTQPLADFITANFEE
jgi:hypothetical protein